VAQLLRSRGIAALLQVCASNVSRVCVTSGYFGMRVGCRCVPPTRELRTHLHAYDCYSDFRYCAKSAICCAVSPSARLAL
jgi:hypothetical protein